jgi:nucleotide-binding universal stress UspA family protein
MTIRTILVPTWAHADVASQLASAAVIAERLGAHIAVLFVQLDSKAALMNLPELVGAGIDFARIEEESETAAHQARKQFDTWCSRHGLGALPAEYPDSRPSASWLEVVGEFGALVEESGRLADFIIISNADTHELLGGRAFQPAVFGTGRPTMIIAETSGAVLDHVMIAWNGSLEASNAVGQSTDLLRAAERVSIYPEGVQREAVLALIAYLRRHGIRTAGEIPVTPANSTGASILATADAAGVTLVVRGAYTQSRLRQAILGGTTRHLLTYARIPILMAH